MSKEPHTEELNTESKIRSSLAHTQTPLKMLTTRSLIDPADLPFAIKDLPDVFTSFRKKVEAPDMYHLPTPAPEKLKAFATLPAMEAVKGALQVDLSEKDLLKSLLKPLEQDPGPLPIPAEDVQDNSLTSFPLTGGETEALERLEHYFRGGKQSPAAHYKETRCVACKCIEGCSPDPRRAQKRNAGRRLLDQVLCRPRPWPPLAAPNCTAGRADGRGQWRQGKGRRPLDSI